MKILAIDTSGKSAALAILEDETVLSESLLSLDVHHSEVLLPAVDHLCRAAGMAIGDMDLFACTTGPGSFTGLRIGLSTVKGLALALSRPVAGVSTLEALALGAAGCEGIVCPLLDARKSQVYAALYRRDASSGVMSVLLPDALSDLDRLLAAIDGSALFVGDGAVRYRLEIEAALPGRCRFAESFNNHVRAAAVGLLGYRRFQAGLAEDALTLIPRYLRLSEAEERARLPEPANGADRG